jgi:transcription initiation factor TFIIE subunit alpha
VSDASNTRKTKALYEFIRRLAFKKKLDPDNAVKIFTTILSQGDTRGLSDEELSAMTGIKQGEIRNVLRMLYELRIVGYRRGRHPETGATRYYWYPDYSGINMTLFWRKKQVLEKLKQRLEYEENNTFFRCPNDGMRFTFEEAYEYDFQCPRCNSMLVEEDNTVIKEVLRKVITRLEEEINKDEKLLHST